MKMKGFEKMKTNRLLKVVTSTATSLYLTLGTTLTVLAADPSGDPTTKINEGTADLAKNLTTISAGIALAAFIAGGIAYMLSDQFAKWAKSHMVRVVIGYMIVVAAGTILSYFVGLAG